MYNYLADAVNLSVVQSPSCVLPSQCPILLQLAALFSDYHLLASLQMLVGIQSVSLDGHFLFPGPNCTPRNLEVLYLTVCTLNILYIHV